MNGLQAVCVERKPMLVKYQTNIDMMKELNVTYVSGAYSFWPGNVSISGMYVWTKHLSQYAKDNGLNPPDEKYICNNYFDKTFSGYISEFEWNDEWTYLKSMNHYLECISENRKDALEYTGELPVFSADQCADRALMLCDFRRQLVLRNIPYSGWRDSSYFDFCSTAVRIIEYALKIGKTDFLIYPYGNFGTLFEDILKKRYGMKSKAVFDQKVSEYRNDIYKIEAISEYIGERSVIVLCTRNQGCLNEIEKFEGMCEIISPYSIF